MDARFSRNAWLSQRTTAQRALLWRRQRRAARRHPLLALPCLAMAVAFGWASLRDPALAVAGPAAASMLAAGGVLFPLTARRLRRRVDAVAPEDFRWFPGLGAYDTWRSAPVPALVGAAVAAATGLLGPAPPDWGPALAAGWVLLAAVAVPMGRRPEPAIPDEPVAASGDGAFARWLRARPPWVRWALVVAFLLAGAAVVSLVAGRGRFEAERFVGTVVGFAIVFAGGYWMGNRTDRRRLLIRVAAVLAAAMGLVCLGQALGSWLGWWHGDGLLAVLGLPFLAVAPVLWRWPDRLARDEAEVEAAGREESAPGRGTNASDREQSQ